MSTWNVDNYHWEEHNCNDWAKNRLNELVSEISLEGWSFSDIKFPTVQVCRSIRKNKEIRSFEVVFECKWQFNEMEGKIQFPDISNDAADCPEEWEYELTFTGDSSNALAAEKKKVRQPAEKNVIPLFRDAFAKFAHEFTSLNV